MIWGGISKYVREIKGRKGKKISDVMFNFNIFIYSLYFICIYIY